MSKLKNLNKIRRKFVRKFTKDVGKQSLPKPIKELQEIKRVLIVRPNHRLGNLLLITPMIQEVERLFPDVEIDILSKGTVSPFLFEQYHSIKSITQLPRRPFNALWDYIKKILSIRRHHDMVINIEGNSSSGRLFTKFSNSKHKVYCDLSESLQKQYVDSGHIAKKPIYALRTYLAASGFDEFMNQKLPLLDIKLTRDELKKGKKLLDDIIKNDKPTIGIFTYATGSKCYSKTWWDTFYSRLQQTYAHQYNIVEILPVENVSQIDFKAPTYYSKDVREICAFINNIDLFIGADSGMMHLASASQTTTIGLFSRTKTSKYEPYGNKSVAIDTRTGTLNDWMLVINQVLG